MVGRGAHHRKSGGVVHAVFESDGLERCQALVVVHGKGGVELLVHSHSEIAVGGEGTEGLDALFRGLFDRRNYYVLLLMAQQAAVAAVRVKAENSDAWIVDSEILLERSLHEAELANDLIHGNGSGNIAERNMSGDHAHFEAVRNHEHGDIFHSESLLEELRVAGETETGFRDAALVDWAGDQHVDKARLEVAHRSVQGGDGCACGFRSGTARFCEHVIRQAVEDIDALGESVFGAGDYIGVDVLHFVDGFLVETENLGGTVHHRGEHIEYALVCQSLDYYFVSYSVAVALGDTDDQFLVIHI